MGLSATVFHIPFIQALPDLFVLHSVMERSASPTNSRARDRYGDGIKVVNSLDEVLTDAEVECVVISTPNDTHFDYAKVSTTPSAWVARVTLEAETTSAARQRSRRGSTWSSKSLSCFTPPKPPS